MALTLDEYIKKERARLDRILTDTKPLFLAANTALSDFSERVFDKGQSIDGATFEYNDDKPLYVNPSKTFGNTSKLKPPTGKNGNTKFKSGKAHKTTYVSSYKTLRELVGREAGHVNFEAFGELKSDIENRSSGQITAKRISDQEYVIGVSAKNEGKLEGLNTKYPNVFRISQAEREKFYTIFNQELLKLIRTP